MAYTLSDHVTPPPRKAEAGNNINSSHLTAIQDSLNALLCCHHPINLFQDSGYIEADGFIGSDSRLRYYKVPFPRRFGIPTSCILYLNVGARNIAYAWGINVYIEGSLVDNFSPPNVTGMQSVLYLDLPDDTDYFEIMFELDEYDAGAGWLEGIFLLANVDYTKLTLSSALVGPLYADEFYLPDNTETASDSPVPVHVAHNWAAMLMALYQVSSGNLIADSRRYEGIGVYASGLRGIITTIDPDDVIGCNTLSFWVFARGDTKGVSVSFWQQNTLIDYQAVPSAASCSWYNIEIPFVSGFPIDIVSDDEALIVESICAYPLPPITMPDL